MITDRTFLSRNQLSLEILVVYCPFSLDSCLQDSDQRPAIILEDHSQVTQLLQGGMNTSDSMWNSTVPWSNVVLPLVLLGAVRPHMDTVPVFSEANSNHHMVQSSTVSFVLKAAPRDSCDLSSPPSVSSKVTFLRSGNLSRNSPMALCALTHAVRIGAIKPGSCVV